MKAQNAANKAARTFVAGHRGLVGSAIVRRLERLGHTNLIVRGRSELDLEDRAAVFRFFEEQRPELVYLAAAKVGGILANSTYPAEFIRSNLAIPLNVVEASHRFDVRKLVMLGSSCIYPKFANQPIKESELLAGPLEPTNEPYAVAKIAGIKLCQSYNRQYGTNYISLMPTNLYGPGDNFDLQSSHVLPALIRRFHEAKVSGSSFVTIWGTGRACREFLHVDDMARACVLLMDVYDSSEIINVGTGTDISIAELAGIVRDVVGFEGDLRFDRSKPDGTPRKVLDVSRLRALGWEPEIELRKGIRQTYEWFLQNAPDTQGAVLA
jgi:GDP-L-fucose synthase